MARIVGIEIPDNKAILYALTYIQGIGKSRAEKVLRLSRVSPTVHTKTLTEEDFGRITQVIEKNFSVEGALRREVRDNIRRLQETGTYRGLRHKRGLPARGQRTRHNARTRKGRKKTVGGISVRKKMEKT